MVGLLWLGGAAVLALYGLAYLQPIQFGPSFPPWAIYVAAGIVNVIALARCLMLAGARYDLRMRHGIGQDDCWDNCEDYCCMCFWPMPIFNMVQMLRQSSVVGFNYSLCSETGEPDVGELQAPLAGSV